MSRVVVLAVLAGLGGLAGCRGLLGLDEAIVIGVDAKPPIDDMVVVDMPIDQMVDLDPDNDNVDDPEDNCPAIANSGQENFDGDARGDACDPCPHLSAMDADADTDQDGLGAGCDPRPLIGGDQRVLFVTFASATDITGWITTAGDWVVSGGTLNQTINNNTTRISLPGAVGNGYFASSADITSVGGAPYVGICTHLTPSTYLCCDVQSSTTQSAMALSDAESAGGTWLPAPYVAGTRIDFEQRSDASGITCSFREGANVRGVTLAATRADGNLALHVRSTAASFRYVFFASAP